MKSVDVCCCEFEVEFETGSKKRVEQKDALDQSEYNREGSCQVFEDFKLGELLGILAFLLELERIEEY